MKDSLPPSWKEFAQYSSHQSEVSAVPEKFILMCIVSRSRRLGNKLTPPQWSLLALAQAYLHRLNGLAGLPQVVECARRIVNYIGILQDDQDFTRIPMHAQLYWSHAINLLSDEVKRLRDAGLVVGESFRVRVR